MRNADVQKLREYLSSHRLVTLTDYWAFYKVYSKYGVDSVKSFRNSYKGFYNFLMRNIDIQAATLSDKIVAKGNIDRSSNYLQSQISGTLDSKYQTYVNIVNDLLGSRLDHVLDVGAGSMPGSSMLLSKDHTHVTTMDDNFDIAPSSLKKMNITPKEEYFDDDTDVSKYDAITGRHPCSAILSMVRKASESGKPYIIELCGCDEPTMINVLNKTLPDMDKLDIPALFSKVTYSTTSGRILVDFGWEDILPMYDPEAKVVGGYVTNLDITREDMLKYLSKYYLLSVDSEPSVGAKVSSKSPLVTMSDIDKGLVRVSVDHSPLSTVNIVRESNDRGSSYWHIDRDFTS